MEDIQAAYKLSQNRNETDYINIIEKLYDEENPDAKQMAELMGSRLKITYNPLLFNSHISKLKNRLERSIGSFL